MIDLSEAEKQRWLKHKEKYTAHSNRYNPNKQSNERYRFLVNEIQRLGSINQVMKAHGVGRTTVHNAIRFVKHNKDETRTEIPQGCEHDNNTPLEAL